MKSIKEKIKIGLEHAINFFNSNNTGVENQRLCVQQMVSLTGFDFDTCVEIQRPILSWHSANNARSLGHELIGQHIGMVQQNIMNHLLNSSNIKLSPEATHEISTGSNRFKSLIEKTSNPQRGDLLLNEKVINVKGANLKDEDVGILVQNLQYQALNLDKFDASYNQLGYRSVENLFYTFRLGSPTALCNIKFIDFSNNSIGDDGAKYIASHLGNGLHPNLTYLDLSGNSITDTGAKALANSFTSSSKLRSLSVTDNKLTSAGTKCFAQALKSSNGENIVVTLETYKDRNAAVDFIIKGTNYYLKQLGEYIKNFNIDHTIVRTDENNAFMNCKKAVPNAVVGITIGLAQCTNPYAKIINSLPLKGEKTTFIDKFIGKFGIVACVISEEGDNIFTPEALGCIIEMNKSLASDEYFP